MILDSNVSFNNPRPLLFYDRINHSKMDSWTAQEEEKREKVAHNS